MKIVEITYRYDGTDAMVRPRPVDADAARTRLDEGSRSIASLLAEPARGHRAAQRVIHVDPRDLGLVAGAHAAARQRPYAAVLGCSDARVPIELIFNEGPNDLFVVRVAGNGLGAEVLGSLKYAVEHLGESLKLIVVLGHSGCGAVSAAVDVFLSRRRIWRSPPSTRCAASSIACSSWSMRPPGGWRRSMERTSCARPGYRNALIESAVVSNAALAAFTRAAGARRAQARTACALPMARVCWSRAHGLGASQRQPRVRGACLSARRRGGVCGFSEAVVQSDRIVALLNRSEP